MRYSDFKIVENTVLTESGTTRISVGGNTYEVGNDLIKQGNSYAIFSGNSAKSYAEANGLVVPPIEVIQAIYQQARKLKMPARNNNPTDTNAQAHTQDIFRANNLSSFPTGLVAGHKKEIVASNGGRTRIFGGWSGSGIIQNDSSVHGGGYVDYSQGMRTCRLVSGSGPRVSTNGQSDALPSEGLTAGPPYPQEEMDAVKALQTKLEALGYTVGNTGIDGKYGPRTTRAVAAYKADFNIDTPANSMSNEELERIKSAEPKAEPTPVAGAEQIDIQPVDDLQPADGSFNGRESRAATIRFNNPGGMYPASWQRRFGGTDTGARIGGGHRIAMFPDRVSGAAALFALLNGSLYRGKTLASALSTWTGNNNVRSYLEYMQGRGIDPNETVANFLANKDAAIALATAMARWETGHVYPMSEEEWREAYDRSGVA